MQQVYIFIFIFNSIFFNYLFNNAFILTIKIFKIIIFAFENTKKIIKKKKKC